MAAATARRAGGAGTPAAPPGDGPISIEVRPAAVNDKSEVNFMYFFWRNLSHDCEVSWHE
jgi:hypothetical protein